MNKDLRRLNYLLQKLVEECSEVQKEVCKTILFGVDDGYPDSPETNKDRIEDEVQDIYASLRMLQEEYDFNFTHDHVKIRNKINKVNRYYEYSLKAQDGDSHTPCIYCESEMDNMRKVKNA